MTPLRSSPATHGRQISGRVAMDVDVVLGGGQQQHRAGDPPAGRPVCLLALAVDAQSCPVVLAHAVHDRRVTQSRPQVGVIALAQLERRRHRVPGVGVGVDERLRPACRSARGTTSATRCARTSPLLIAAGLVLAAVPALRRAVVEYRHPQLRVDGPAVTSPAPP